MVEDHPTNGESLLAYRVGKMEGKVEQFEIWKNVLTAENATAKQQLVFIREDMNDLRNAVAGLRRMLIGFIMTVATSSVAFAFTVLVSSHRI